MNENLNSSPQVVVQRVSSFQLNCTTFSTRISRDIIRHSLNFRRSPSTMSHQISLGLLINHWESILYSLSYYRDPSSDQVWWRYTEKTLSREGINILTSHHVERVEAVILIFSWCRNLHLTDIQKGKMIVTEQGEGMHFLFESKEPDLLKSHRSSIWSTCLEHWSSTELSCSSNIWGQERWQNFEVRLQDSRYILAVHTCWLSVSLITNDHLNVIMNDGKSNPDVWAIGDAAIIEDAPLPATSQGQYYPW